MKKIYSFLLSIVTLLLPSCMSTYYQTFFQDKQLQQAMRAVDTLHNREVILLGMPHLGTEKGYDALRRYILDRSAEGYVFFLEGVAHYDPDVDGVYDSLKQDTIERKMRFVIGFTLGSYTDKENKSLPEMYRNTKQAIDPTVELLGFDSITDGVYLVDLSLRQIVELFESKYGAIPLTEYDFQTPLKAKYEKNKDYPYDIFAIASPVREMYIIDCVVRSKHPKIIIMYGASHLHHILSKLWAIGYDHYQFNYLKKEKSKARNYKTKTK